MNVLHMEQFLFLNVEEMNNIDLAPNQINII
jgi:hypothetical protein